MILVSMFESINIGIAEGSKHVREFSLKIAELSKATKGHAMYVKRNH
jgi:hypothetical protein